MDRRREIYIKIDELSQVVKLLKSVKEKQEKVNSLFEQYDSLTVQENEICENWHNYLEDTFTRMDNMRL